MKFLAFHLMPYAEPDAMAAIERSEPRRAWVTFSNTHFDPKRGSELYRRYLDELVHAVEVGFDGVGVNEHHQNAYGTMPSPNVMAAALTQRLDRGLIAVLGNALPLHRPQQIAEQIAMLDLLSEGRIISGFVRGIGFEYLSFNVNPTESRERFLEAHDLIIRSWTEPGPFSWHGRFYDYDYVNVWPRPLQKPHPPVWIPSQGSNETVQWVAERGYSYLQTFTKRPRLAAIMREFREAARAAGHTATPEQQGWAVPTYVGESDEQARRELAPHVDVFFNKLLTGDVHNWFPPGYLSEESHARVVSSKSDLFAHNAHTLERLEEDGMIVVGSAETVTERFREIIDETGVGVVLPIVQMGSMPHEQTMASIERLGRRVLPKLRNHVSAVYREEAAAGPG
ncbi:LLM class flavin-dependent oxidoreductase [Allosalinactinospora lopnorensis]|uniref:LLM class flavin-dependent oxidoreductase n=1 Tax=Allosalinactinospora lopnorensis TaxID=1352348 RepID=UPI000623ED9C|nr:LLM class flavin-dependent oxidoreductase [Allosalinactinospora lopnorensis]